MTRAWNRTGRSGTMTAIWMPATVDTSGTSSGEPSVLVDALGESFQARDPLVDRRGRAGQPGGRVGGGRGDEEKGLRGGDGVRRMASPFCPPAPFSRRRERHTW